MAIKIGKIDVLGEADYFRRPDGITLTWLWFSPDKQLVHVVQQQSENAITHNLYHLIELEMCLENDGEGPPDADELRDFLEGAEGQGLLDRVANGHQTTWDGHNFVGSLSQDAAAAWGALHREISLLPRNQTESWLVEAWLGDASDKDLGIEPGMGAHELSVLCSQIRLDAFNEGVHIIGSIADYLQQRIEEMNG